MIHLLLHKRISSRKDAPPGARWRFYVDRVSDRERSKVLSRGRPLPRGVDQIPIELAKQADLVPARIEYHGAPDPYELYYRSSSTVLSSKAWICLEGELERALPSSKWRGYVYPLESWPDLNTFDGTGGTMSGMKSWQQKSGPWIFSLAFRLPTNFNQEKEFDGLQMALLRLEGSPAKHEFDETAIAELLDQRHPTRAICLDFEWGTVHAVAEVSERMGENICKITVSMDFSSARTRSLQN